MNLSIKNASVNLEGNTILEYVNFDIKDNDHIAIVGRNGAGKTTLLKAIIDNELFEEGIGEEKFSITKIGKFNIGYLKQIEFDNENITLLEEIKKSFKDLINMEERINEYVSKMNKSCNNRIISEYTDLLERFNLLGGYSYQKEYEVMLNKFGFTSSDKGKPIKEFSGGQKTKIAFIKLLLSKPDLLILDEPTNHLDINTIEWLEDYLKKYKKALIIVSHDRMFINNVAGIIYDIEYGKTTKYIGSYEFYEKQKQLNYEKALSDYEYQQKEIKRLRGIYERFRFKPTKASLAMSRLHQLEKMDILEKPNKIDERVFKTNLKEIKPSGSLVLKAKNLEIGYHKILAKLNLNIERGMKIGIIGPNGIGKSTLLKTLYGLKEPLRGKISYGANVNTEYFDQSLAMIDSNKTILEEFQDTFNNLSTEQARNALGSFLFKGDDVYKKINVLSGGEKVRLNLCKIFYNKPNFLILDEPTNHLDIIGKEHLEEILNQYKGTIIFVSHDRYFIKKIAKQLLVFENNEIDYYPYGYEQYISKKKLEEEPELYEEKNKISKKKEIHSNISKEINKLEKEITNLEQEIKKLNQELLKENVYNDYNKAEEINKKLMDLQEELDKKNNKWFEFLEKQSNN